MYEMTYQRLNKCLYRLILLLKFDIQRHDFVRGVVVGCTRQRFVNLSKIERISVENRTNDRMESIFYHFVDFVWIHGEIAVVFSVVEKLQDVAEIMPEIRKANG